MAGISNDTVQSWLQARAVIAQFLTEIRAGLSVEDYEHNAAAIIARLAQHNPPLLIGYAHEFKDD